MARSIRHGTDSATLADVLERILDQGIVIAGDVKVKLLDIELLTIQLKLVICSVDKARSIGLDWWAREPGLGAGASQVASLAKRVAALEGRGSPGGARRAPCKASAAAS